MHCMWHLALQLVAAEVSSAYRRPHRFGNTQQIYSRLITRKTQQTNHKMYALLLIYNSIGISFFAWALKSTVTCTEWNLDNHDNLSDIYREMQWSPLPFKHTERGNDHHDTISDILSGAIIATLK